MTRREHIWIHTLDMMVEEKKYREDIGRAYVGPFHVTKPHDTGATSTTKRKIFKT